MFTAGLCNLAFFAFLAMEWTLPSAQLPHPICGHLLCLRREVVNSRPSCGGSTSLVAPFPYKGCATNQSCGAGGRKQLWAWPLLCCCWDNPACLVTPQLPQAHLAVTNPSRLFLQKFPMTSFSIKLTLWCMWSQGENRKTGCPFRECFFVRLVAVFNSSRVACNQNRNCSDAERLVPDEIVTGDTCSSDLVFGMCKGEKSVLVGSFIHSAFKN